jgi:hypothetical protein
MSVPRAARLFALAATLMVVGWACSSKTRRDQYYGTDVGADWIAPDGSAGGTIADGSADAARGDGARDEAAGDGSGDAFDTGADVTTAAADAAADTN